MDESAFDPRKLSSVLTAEVGVGAKGALGLQCLARAVTVGHSEKELLKLLLHLPSPLINLPFAKLPPPAPISLARGPCVPPFCHFLLAVPSQQLTQFLDMS